MMRLTTTFLLLALACLVAMLPGCLTREGNPTATVLTASGQGSPIVAGADRTTVEMKIVGDQDGLPGAIRGSGLGSVTVRFALVLLNPGNDASPTTTLVMVVPVSPDGTASASFVNIPLATIIGDVRIEGGRIGSHSTFHGAMDLASGTRNTVLLAPRGSNSPVAVLAATLEQIVASPTLFIRVQPGLAAVLERSLTGFDRSLPSIVDQLITSFVRANPVVTTIGTDSSGLATRTTTVMTVTGLPTEISNAASATITIGGQGILAYRYRLDSGAWSDEIVASLPLSLNGLSQGDHQLQIVTKSANGVWQSLDTPSAFPWSIDLTPPEVAVNALTTATSTPIISGTVENGIASLSVWVNSIECKAVVAGTAWTARVLTPLLNGTYNIAAKAVDAAGNIGRDTTTNELTVDTNALTVALSTTATSPTRLPMPVTVSFAKDVVDFNVDKVAVTNGTKSGFSAIDGRRYVLTVTPAADGLVQVDLAANAAHDSAGTGNAAATPLTLTFDATSPGAPTIAAVITPTRMTPQILTGTKPADAATVLVNGNGAGVSFPTPTTWRAVFDLAAGANAISVTCRDIAGNDSAPATSEIVFHTGTATPTVTVTALTTNLITPTIRGTVESGVATVSVRVNGFDYPALVTGTTWVATITRSLANGVYNVEVRAVNAIGNAGFDLTADELTIDRNAMLVTLSTTASNPTRLSLIPVTVTFSRDPATFTLMALPVSNGTASLMVAQDSRTFTCTVIPSAEGLVEIWVPPFSVGDAAGTFNQVQEYLPITFDTTPPATPTIDPVVTPTGAMRQTIGGSKPSDAASVLVNGSNLTVVYPTTTTWRAVLELAAGANPISVKCRDLAGNESAVATSVIDCQTTGPTAPTINAVTTPTNVSPQLIGGTKAATATLVLVNGSSDGVTYPTATTWQFSVPLSAGANAISVKARDAAGNDSVAATTSITYDPQRPFVVGVTSAKPDGLYDVGTVIDLSVVFNKTVRVSGTPQLRLKVGSNLERTINYFGGDNTASVTFRYTVQAGDEITRLDCVHAAALTLNGGTITDTATNDAILQLPVPGEAGSLGITKALTIDTIAPSVTVFSTRPDGSLDLSPIPFVVTFSEPVTGFTATSVWTIASFPDLAPVIFGSMTVENFVAVSPSTYTFEITPIGTGAINVIVPASAARDGIGHESPLGQLSYQVPGGQGEDVSFPVAGGSSKFVLVPRTQLPDGTWVPAFYCMKYAPVNEIGFPVSHSGGNPWTSITWNDAKAACALASAALISERQWLAIAHNSAQVAGNWTGGSVGSGMMIRGHSNETPASAAVLPASEYEPYYETNDAVGSGTEQRRTRNLTNGAVIWDIGGNLWQWVDATQGGSPAVGPTTGWIDTNDAGITNVNVKTIYSAASGTGRINNDTTAGRAFMRGGTADTASGAGAFALDLTHDPTYATSTIGFRGVLAP